MSVLPPQWYVGIVPSLGDWQASFAWAAGFTSVPTGFFYADDGANVRHIADRFLMGAAADNLALRNRDATPTDWLSAMLHGTNVGAWPVWSAQAASLARFGTIGFLGASRTSDARANAIALGYSPDSAPASIGIAGFVYNDDTANPTSTTGWAGYFDATRTPGVNYKPTFGIEAEVTNLGALPVGISTPYHVNVGGGTYCLQLGSGGGRSNANAASGVFNVVRNPAQFQQGIVVQSDALVGTDGSIGDTGYAAFLSLGRNQGVQWYAPDGNVAAIHWSGVSTAALGNRIIHQDNQIVFADNNNNATLVVHNSGLVSMPGANAGIEVGNFSLPSNPYLNFHSSGNSGVFDSRITAGGGNGTQGSGALVFFCGDARFTGNVDVDAGTVSLYRGDLSVLGTTTLGVTNITDTLTAGGALNVAGTLTAGGFLNAVGDTTLGGALNVVGLATMGGAFNVVGPTTLGGPVGIPGVLTVASTFSVVHNGGVGEAIISLIGDGPITPKKYLLAHAGQFQVLSDAGAAILTVTDIGTMTVVGSLQCNLDVGIARNIAISGLFSASGASTFGSVLNVAGNLTAGASFSVVGNTVHGGTTALNGKTTLGTGATINVPMGAMVAAANDGAAASGGASLGDMYINSSTGAVTVRRT